MGTGRRNNAETVQADVTVLGAGGAGLAAAVASAEEGASVVVLEKRKTPGGNSALAQAFFAAESPAQKRLWIDAPKDVLFKMAMDYAHWGINPRIIRAFIDKSGDTVRWLEEMGLEPIDYIPPIFPKVVIRTFHFPKGGGIDVISVLLKRCEDLGVRVFYQTSAKQIVTDATATVTGVVATARGEKLQVATRKVIIATGGFGGNKKLIRRFYPSYSKEIRSLGVPNMGDGLLMATQVGAATVGGILLLEGPIFEGARQGTGVWQEPEMIWVNKKGERFADEASALNHFESVNALLAQPGKVSYTLFDEPIKQALIKKIEQGFLKFRGLTPRSRKTGPPSLEEDLLFEADKGTVKISESWDEMASWIGAGAAQLRSTVDQYNDFCDHGHDTVFAKDRRYLVPVRTPPYYGMRCYPLSLAAIGGIRINHHMQVVNEEHDPIPGLYAAGNDAGGWQPNTYNATLAGSAFGFALNSGRIAGENAALYVPDR